MIKRCRVTDANEVNRIMTHPDVYPKISDDGCPEAGDYDVTPLLECDAIYCLGWMIDGIWAGMWLFEPRNTITYEGHICILPGFRGAAAVRATEDAFRWMFRNTACRKVVALIPEGNKPAIAFAMLAGMRKEGLVKRSFLKGGKVVDQQLLGIEKEE